MSINKTDILVVGAGPSGVMSACALAVTNPTKQITVIDSRQVTKRNYALNFAYDAIGTIQNILKDHLQNRDVKDLSHLLQSWQGRAVSTMDIENELAQKAKALGVQILRKDAYRPLTTKEAIPQLFDSQITGSAEKQELQQLFQSAQIIIGADGAHSDLRQAFAQGGDEEKRVEIKDLQYFIELKYQTHQETKQLRKDQKLFGSSKQGVAFETLSSKKQNSVLKPATVHFFVGQNTYDAFEGAKNEHPWNLEQLQEAAVSNPVVENQACKIAHYLWSVFKRQGNCIEPQIKRLPISVYRSPQAAVLHEKKVILFVGDALSGAVFARGVNKAFLESALLAKAVQSFFSEQVPLDLSAIPQPFKEYEKAVFQIYESERRWAVWKATGLKIVRLLLRGIMKPLKWLASPFKGIYLSIEARFIKRPTLGDIIQQLQTPLAK